MQNHSDRRPRQKRTFTQIQEVTILTSNIQVQVKAREQKMVGQRIADLENMEKVHDSNVKTLFDTCSRCKQAPQTIHRSQGWQIEKFRKVSTAVQISFPT